MLLEEKHYKFVSKIAKFFKMGIDIEESLLTNKMIEKFHNKKLKVNCWTIDDELVLRKMEDMGVDYITTNVFDQNS